MTSSPKSTGIFSRDSSTATRCSSLNFFVSLSHRIEPAPPLRSASSGLAPGKSPPATWVSWPTFSSSVICARSASTLRATSASGTGEAAGGAALAAPAAHENPIVNAHHHRFRMLPPAGPMLLTPGVTVNTGCYSAGPMPTRRRQGPPSRPSCDRVTARPRCSRGSAQLVRQEIARAAWRLFDAAGLRGHHGRRRRPRGRRVAPHLLPLLLLEGRRPRRDLGRPRRGLPRRVRPAAARGGRRSSPSIRARHAGRRGSPAGRRGARRGRSSACCARAGPCAGRCWSATPSWRSASPR